jgi:polar amino acid transport system substrate-binding protein
MKRISTLSLTLTALIFSACSASPSPAVPAAAPQVEAPKPTGAPTQSRSRQDILDQIRGRGVLRVSTAVNYAPQSFFDETTQAWTGFDIDVANEVAKRLGLKVEFVTPDWSAITAGNWAGRWDISVGSMAITPERQQMLYFTMPYYYTYAQFAVRADLKEAVKSIADLSGRTVCVGEATTYEQYLSGRLSLQTLVAPPKDVKVAVVKTDAECVQSMQSGRKDYDAVLTSWTVVNDGVRKGAPIVALGDPVYYEDLAIALDKAAVPNTKLLALLNEIVQDMQAEGRLTALSKQYYDGQDLTKPVK